MLIYFRDTLADFYLSLSILQAIVEKHEGDLITLHATPSAVSLLSEGQQKWFHEILTANQVPSRKYSKVYVMHVQATGTTAVFDSSLTYWDIQRSQYDFLDLPKTRPVFDLELTDKEIALATSLYREHRSSKNKTVLLNTSSNEFPPYGKTPSKQWWTELLGRFSNHVFLQVGTLKDYDMNLFTGLKNVVDLREKLSIRETTVLMQRVDFHLSVDTLFSHLSFQHKKRGLVIWGSSDHKVMGHDFNHNMTPRELICSPCDNLTKNKDCCLRRDTRWFNSGTVDRQLRDTFLLQPPNAKRGWLLEKNPDLTTKNL